MTGDDELLKAFYYAPWGAAKGAVWEDVFGGYSAVDFDAFIQRRWKLTDDDRQLIRIVTER